MAYDVFISYRRKGGAKTARLLYGELKARGYSPFYDIKGMHSGKFPAQIFARIAECDAFLLILSPNALDPCEGEKDWVRLELQEAIRLHKKIVPYFMEGFEFPSELPSEINDVRNYEYVVDSEHYFNTALERLDELLNDEPAANLAAENPHEETRAKHVHVVTTAKDKDEMPHELTEAERKESIARNKARRIAIGRTITKIALILTVTSAISLGVNILVKAITNSIFDSWLYPNGDGTVVSAEMPHPLLLMVIAATVIPLCYKLFMKGVDIESITLKILAVLLYILLVFTLHLLPTAIFSVLQLILVIFIIIVIIRTLTI